MNKPTIRAWWDGERRVTVSVARPDAHNWEAKLPLIWMTDHEAAMQEHEGMAASMHMLRQDMIEAGIVGESCPPMFMTEGVLGYIGKVMAERDELLGLLREAHGAIRITTNRALRVKIAAALAKHGDSQ